MKSLFERISQNNSLQKLGELFLSKDSGNILLRGLVGSTKAFAVASAFASSKETICVVMPDRETASYFYDDLVSILDDESVMFYPSAFKRSVEFLKENKSNIVLQTEVLTRISTTKKAFIIVSYPEAIIEKVVKTKELTKNTINLGVDEEMSMEMLVEMLNDWNFSHEDFVFEPGSYAVRGSLIDVFSYGAEKPYRIDFDDDRIEKIREFDPETQSSTNKLRKIRIVPNFYDKQTITERISFFEFCNNNVSVWIDSPDYVVESISKNYSLAELRYNELSDKEILDEETVIINPKSSLIGKDEFVEQAKNVRVVEFASRSYFNAQSELVFNTEPQPVFKKQFELVIADIKQNIEDGYKVYILSNNEKQLQRINDIFTDK
ncbi:MAG: hypothetical protein HUK15_01460, partial [Bacteroidales bacterium]|nr:hypothetical protein [Bacteroidales bacterium]